MTTKFFLGSKLGCLLLHCNYLHYQRDIRQFNPFLMIQVNLRKKLIREKLAGFSTREQKDQNTLWKMVTAFDSNFSPITASGCYGILASFREGDTSNQNSMAKLTPVYDDTDDTDGLSLYATSPDRQTVVNALKWLDPQATILPEASLEELSDQFLSCLNDSPVPNGTVESMTEFINSRTWDERHLWGGTMEEFWNMVESIEHSTEKWRILRLFITYNIAWQTKLILFPCDALHRLATSDMSFNGVCLPSSHADLQKAVTDYAKMLVPVDETHPILHIRREDGTQNEIDGLVKLNYYLPSPLSFHDPNFYEHMLSLSARSQHDSELLTSHSVLNVLDTVLFHFKNQLAGELSYLYYPGDRSKGIEATLCGLKKSQDKGRDDFRKLLVNDGLCNTDRHTDSWDDLRARIEACNKFKNCWDEKDNLLSDVYIAVWLEKFSKVAYEALKKIFVTNSVFGNIDTKLQLNKIPDMSLEQFQRMFKQYKRNEKSYDGEGFLESYRLDSDQLSKPPALSVFNKNIDWI